MSLIESVSVVCRDVSKDAIYGGKIMLVSFVNVSFSLEEIIIVIFRPHKWKRKIMICGAIFVTNVAKSPSFTSLLEYFSYLTILLT